MDSKNRHETRDKSSRASFSLPSELHFVADLDELEALGLGRNGAAHRVNERKLRRIHDGVFTSLPKQAMTPGAHTRAAVLASGRGALLGGRWAGWLWGIHPLPRGGRIEVVVPKYGRKEPRGVRHRVCTVLEPADYDEVDAIPVTSLARTLLDLATVLNQDELADVLDQSVKNGSYDHPAVAELLERSRGRPGVPLLERTLEEWSGSIEHYNSLGERALKRLMTEGGLPSRPSVNYFLHGRERDYYFANARLVVEYDGWNSHKTRAQQELDRIRDNELGEHSIPVRRITGRRAYYEPKVEIEGLRKAINARLQELSRNS